MVQNWPFCIEYMMQDPNSGKPSQILIVAQCFKATPLQDNAFEHYLELGAQMIETHFVSHNTDIGSKSVCIVLPVKRALLLDPIDQSEDDVGMHLIDEMTDVQDGEDMTVLEVHSIAGQQT
ncbi:hypothetical protein EDD18DRAFT_1098817 [Armillaria luteobubalina]|uniref:Uncharacterized protein n=1 Tax=Armillaria luteobubalina TaxID=153913 RepID=A0AA39V051_9AGAR|nr:hypothetical protein EDD18DRAFT_1098817 [Armillaria luteobubalina]